MNTPQAIKNLVVNECANHLRTGPEGIKNHCYGRTVSRGKFVCIYFQEVVDPRCYWFEKAVLPLDGELNEEFKKREERNGGEATDRAAVQREGARRGAGRVAGISPQSAGDGVSVGQLVREGVLPRPAFHGMGAGKPGKSRRPPTER